MRGIAVAICLLCALALRPALTLGQERAPRDASVDAPGREHFQLKLGAAYDQGDFGTPDTTRSVFAPFTLRYLGEQFDVGVTAAIAYLDTESSVVLIDGVPTPTGHRRRSHEVGFGDLVFRARYYAVDDAGPDSAVPALAPFLKVKAPTADARKGLGTGEWDVGLGLEWDKQFRHFFLLGDVGYTFIGDPPGQDFRDRPAASIGIGHAFLPWLAVTALLDWRRALVKDRDDPLELVAIVQLRVARHLVLSPYAFAGLTSGSPDFGIGAELSWRFGRY
jgi:hypothetical protein